MLYRYDLIYSVCFELFYNIPFYAQKENGKSQTRHEDATEDRQRNMFGIHQSSLTIMLL